jgi:hypothetical protein
MADPPAFTCPICKRPSWHPRDAKERYCGVCGFIDPVVEQVPKVLRSGDALLDDVPEDAADG